MNYETIQSCISSRAGLTCSRFILLAAFLCFTSPVYSSQILYTSNESGTTQVYRVDSANPRDKTRLTNIPGGAYAPQFSPDKSQISFCSGVSSPAGVYLEVFLAEADGSNSGQLTHQGFYSFAPAWSPDGSKIFYRSTPPGPSGLYLINVDGSDNHSWGPSDLEAGWPRISPDGNFVAMEGMPSGYSQRGIVRTTAAGSGLTLLSPGNTDDSAPFWSPDSSQIVFQNFSDGMTQIFKMNADGSGRVQLTHADLSARNPVWSPDGGRIVYSCRDHNGWQLRTINPDGTGDKQLLNGQGQKFPYDWK